MRGGLIYRLSSTSRPPPPISTAAPSLPSLKQKSVEINTAKRTERGRKGARGGAEDPGRGPTERNAGNCKFPAVLFDRPVCIDSEVRSLVCLCVCSFVCNPAATTIEVRTLGWARGICQFCSYISAVAIAVRRIKSVAILAQVFVAFVCHITDRFEPSC